MKLTTLVKIAKEIESEHGICAGGMVREMFNRLREVAGNCRMKSQAKQAIASLIYGIA
jgi:hypothetical protein